MAYTYSNWFNVLRLVFERRAYERNVFFAMLERLVNGALSFGKCVIKMLGEGLQKKLKHGQRSLTCNAKQNCR